MQFILRQQDYTNPRSLSARFRRNRAKHIVALIRSVFEERGSCRILDLGGRPDYWAIVDRALLESCKVQITTVNLEPQTPVDDRVFVQKVADACALDVEDNAFDIAHSNSVIEHVGDWHKMEQFAAETRRVARRYYVQTPYFWFPFEPHYSALFFHWTPEPLRARRIMARQYGFRPKVADMGEAMHLIQEARLLDKAMMRHLFPDGRHVDETVAGLTKSLMAIRG